MDDIKMWKKENKQMRWDEWEREWWKMGSEMRRDLGLGSVPFFWGPKFEAKQSERESEWEPNAKQSYQAHYCVYIYREILTFKFFKEKKVVRNWWENWSNLRVSSNINFVFVLIVWVIFVVNTIIHFYTLFNLK